MAVGEQDSQFWKLISEVPRVVPAIAWIAFIINVLLPGFGTILIGCMGERGESGISKT